MRFRGRRRIPHSLMSFGIASYTTSFSSAESQSGPTEWQRMMWTNVESGREPRSSRRRSMTSSPGVSTRLVVKRMQRSLRSVRFVVLTTLTPSASIPRMASEMFLRKSSGQGRRV